MSRSPFTDEGTYYVHVLLKVLWSVGRQFMNHAVAVAVASLLQNGLEYLTLYIVSQLLPRVTSEGIEI